MLKNILYMTTKGLTVVVTVHLLYIYLYLPLRLTSMDGLSRIPTTCCTGILGNWPYLFQVRDPEMFQYFSF